MRNAIINRLRDEFELALLEALKGGICRTMRLLVNVTNGQITHARNSSEDAVDRTGQGLLDADAAYDAMTITKQTIAALNGKLDGALLPGWFGEVSVELLIANGNQQRLYAKAERLTKYLDSGKARG